MQAVLTADIANSTKLEVHEFEKLVAEIKLLYASPDLIEFYRGDSFQALVKDANVAYKSMLLSRLKAISYSMGDRIDIRFSISLGKVQKEIDKLGSHLEEVFVNSGRGFDKFNNQASDRLLLITCGDSHYDFSYELIARYTDNLLSQISAKQAMALFHLFSGKSQKETAILLRKSSPTINQQLKTARFEELKDLVSKYQELTNIISHGK